MRLVVQLRQQLPMAPVLTAKAIPHSRQTIVTMALMGDRVCGSNSQVEQLAWMLVVLEN